MSDEHRARCSAACCEAPKAQRAVFAAADKPIAVQTERQSAHRTVVAAKRNRMAGRIDVVEIPQADHTVIASCRQPPPVPRKRRHLRRLFVAQQGIAAAYVQLISNSTYACQVLGGL